LVESATLVAVIVTVAEDAGAVKRPEPLMVPADAAQVTPVFDVPVTVAVNCCWALTATKTGLGETVIAIPPGVGDGVGVGVGAEEVTVMVAVPLLVESLVLVAVTVHVPVKLGAVYVPVEETAPPFVLHVTLPLDAPPTAALNCWVPPTLIEAEGGLTVTPLLVGPGLFP
jgi:hypothetical protein